MSNFNNPTNIPALFFVLCWLPVWASIIYMIPEEDDELILYLSVIASTSFFIHCCILCYSFIPSVEGFQYSFDLFVIREYDLALSFGLDGISMCFLLLTAYIFPICFLSGGNTLGFKYKQFVIYVFILESFLVFSFCVTNLFFFFIFFESVLLPMYAIIGLWGSRDRKINASFYFFFIYFIWFLLFTLWNFISTWDCGIIWIRCHLKLFF